MNDQSTPVRTLLERFARNFRNSKRVEDYYISKSDNRVRVTFDHGGYNFWNLRDKGWTFEVEDIRADSETITVTMQLQQ